MEKHQATNNVVGSCTVATVRGPRLARGLVKPCTQPVAANELFKPGPFPRLVFWVF